MVESAEKPEARSASQKSEAKARARARAKPEATRSEWACGTAPRGIAVCGCVLCAGVLVAKSSGYCIMLNI